MDRLKSVAKGGWHPEKDAASNSGGGPNDSKLGQVKGWVGRAHGKDVHAESARQHQSTPLATLKDPSSFAPPPRRVAHGHGLSDVASSHPAPVPTERPKPNLPPRLPPRQNSNPHANTPLPPPSYNEATQPETPSEGFLNQGVINRLGQAGVSVPGFGIGKAVPPPVPSRQNVVSNAATPSPTFPEHESRAKEQMSRLAGIATPTPSSAAPAEGTSWADKQATLRTANVLCNDPSKVKTSDLRAATATANNFRQRHGEQVASGWKTASGLNAKYGIADRVNHLPSPSNPASPHSLTKVAPKSLGKKTPPPLPPKKKVSQVTPAEPPPIPLSSKPKC